VACQRSRCSSTARRPSRTAHSAQRLVAGRSTPSPRRSSSLAKRKPTSRASSPRVWTPPLRRARCTAGPRAERIAARRAGLIEGRARRSFRTWAMAQANAWEPRGRSEAQPEWLLFFFSEGDKVSRAWEETFRFSCWDIASLACCSSGLWITLWRQRRVIRDFLPRPGSRSQRMRWAPSNLLSARCTWQGESRASLASSRREVTIVTPPSSWRRSQTLLQERGKRRRTSGRRETADLTAAFERPIIRVGGKNPPFRGERSLQARDSTSGFFAFYRPLSP
jgi:hypothetical protein